MKNLFKKWWFWAIAIVVVIGIIGAGGNSSEIISETPSSTTTSTTAVDGITLCIKQLSTYDNITTDAVDVFVEVIPNFAENFDHIDQEGTVLSHVFNLYLKDGTRLLVVTFAGGEFEKTVATIMSSEEDPDMRTRYYNVKIKDGKLVQIN